MLSFFDKLKKGMNIESDFEEPEEEQSPVVKKQRPIAEKKQTEAKKVSAKEKAVAKKKDIDFAAHREKEAKKTDVVAKEEPVASFATDEVDDKEPSTDGSAGAPQDDSQNEPAVTEEKEMAENEEPKMPAAASVASFQTNQLKAQKNMAKNTTKNTEEKSVEQIVVNQKEAWPETEGELVVDVYQTDGELVVQSAVAGIKPEELDIDIEKDILVIKGVRNNNDCEKRDYFFQECYWGSFSRQIILPVEVDASRVKAEMREGVLTIRMPKIVREGKKKISVQAS